MRAQTTIGLLLVCSLGFSTVGTKAEPAGSTLSNLAYYTALQFFRALAAGDLRDALRAVRPAALPSHDRARALLTLPSEGELTPAAREARHLAQLLPVLVFHERVDAVTIKIIDLPGALVGLHARSILLLSRPAMALLSTGQLQGVVAHEMGHDFFWKEYYSARERHDRRALQTIELKCDGIAVLTLRALGADPGLVESGVRAMARFNEALAPINAADYPDTDARVQFMRDVLALRQSR